MTTADWARIIGQGPAWKKVTFTKKRGFEEDMLSYLEGGPEPQGQQAGPNNQSPSESETESSTSEDNDDKELPNQDVQLKNMAYLASSIAARQGNANMHRQMQEEIQRRAAARPEQQNAIPNQQLQPQSHQHQQEQADTNQAIDSNPICSFCRDIVHIDPSGHYKEACPHRWYIKKQPLLEFLEKDMPGNITMIDGTREYPEDLHDIIKEAWRKLQEWVKGHIKKELEPKMRERMQLLQHSNRDDQDPIEESELLRSLLEQCLVGSQASSSVLTRYDPYYFHQNNPNRRLGSIKLLLDELFPEELPKPAAEPSLDGQRQRQPPSHLNAYEGIRYGHRQQQAQEDQGQQREQQQQQQQEEQSEQALPEALNAREDQEINLVTDSDEED